jgi:tetratricopeptide (TPR) repeat protein
MKSFGSWWGKKIYGFMQSIGGNIFLTSIFVMLACLAPAVSAEMADAGPTVGYWAPRQPPRANYKIDCTVTPGKVIRLEGNEIISFVNTTTRPMQTLALTWTELGERELKVRANGEAVNLPEPIESFPQDFELAEPVEPGDSVMLEVEFSLVPFVPGEPNTVGPVKDWPRLWWGFKTHDDYQVKLDFPDGYAVAASGRINSRTGYYCAEGIPSFGFFLGKGYNVFQGRAGDVVVRCLYEPGDEKCAELVQETAIDVINFYRERFGFYPYDVLNIIPGMDRPAGGYPVATNIICIHGMGRMEEKSELHWQWITAHEVGHQYWGRYVMEKDDPGWLWIGLGIYADREYCRARELGNRKHQELMDRYIKAVRDGLDTTINITPEQHSKIDFDFNNIVIHGKGFGVISALECVLGDSLFDRICRRCLKKYAGRRLGLYEFRTVCEQESSEDLGWFFDQWVDSNKCLSYEVASQNCNKKGDFYVTEVEVHRLRDLKMPIPVKACFEDGSAQRAFTNRLRKVDAVRFDSRSPLKEVQLDPDGELPLVVPPPPMTPEQLTDAIENLPWTNAGEKALKVFKETRGRELTNTDSWIKLALVLYDGKYDEQALEMAREYQVQAKGNSLRIFLALSVQGLLLDLLGQRQEAIKCYSEALETDAKAEIALVPYGIEVLNRQWVRERLKEPFRRK